MDDRHRRRVDDSRPGVAGGLRSIALAAILAPGMLLAGLVLLVVVLIAGALCSAGASRVGVAWGIHLYSEMVPGGISVSGVDGRLAGDLVLRGLRLEDRRGEPLIEIGRLRLGVRPRALLSGRIDLGRIEVDGARVFLPSEGDPGFADLVPPAVEDAIADEEDEELGPMLPVPVFAKLLLRDAKVLSATGEGELAAASALGFAVRAWGRRALAAFLVDFSLPPAGLEPARLAADIEWDEPLVRMTRMALRSDWGGIDVGEARLDVSKLAAVIEDAVFEAAPSLVDSQLGILPAGPSRAFLSGAGDYGNVDVRLRIDAPKLLDATATVVGDPRGELSARVELSCAGCDPGEQPPSLVLRAGGRPAARSGGLEAEIEGAGGRIESRADIEQDGTFRGSLDLDVPDLARLMALLGRFVPAPKLAGALRAKLGCRGSSSPPAISCEAEAGLGRGAAARIAASGRLADDEGLDLDLMLRGFELAGLDALGLDLGLGGNLDLDAVLFGTRTEPELTARVNTRGLRWREHRLESLRANLGYAAGRGRLQARGRSRLLGDLRLEAGVPVSLPRDGEAAGMPGNLPARARVRIAGGDLAGLAALAPEPLPLSGTIDLDGVLAGTIDRPRIGLKLRAGGASFAGVSPGEVRADLTYARGSARAEVEVDQPLVGSLRATAQSALKLDLAGGAVSWNPGSVRQASVFIEDARLELLEPWLPAPSLAGAIDLEAVLDGGLEGPAIDVRLALRDVEVDGRRAGGLEARADYSAGELGLLATGGGPGIETLEVTARVPAVLSPARGRFSWEGGENHEIDVKISGLRLEEAMAWLPEAFDIEGGGDVSIRVRGIADAPVAAVALSMSGLRYGGRAVGDLEAEASFEDELADAAFVLHHDAARAVSARASMPLRIDARRREIAWMSERPHRLRVSAPLLDRSLVEPFVELPAKLDFRLALRIDGRGDITSPELDLRLTGDVDLPGGAGQPLDVLVSAGATAQRARLKLGAAERPLLALQGRLGMPIEAVARGTASPTEAPLLARVRADLDLGLAAGLSPGMVAHPSGRLDLRAAVDGTVGEPRVDGTLAVRDGALTLVPLRQRFEGLGLDAAFDHRRIELESLTAGSGRGTLEAKGHLDFGGPGLAGELRLGTERLPLRKPGLPRMELTCDLLAGLDASGERTRIGVDVRKTRVDLSLARSAAAKPIPASTRVVIVGPGYHAANGEEAPPTDGKPLELRVRLADPVRIVGPAIDMSWEGAVSAVVFEEAVESEGSLAARGGHFELLGNRFRIEEGQISIPPGTDAEPFIDLRADTRVADVEISAHVRGRVSRPELLFVSNPAMTQSQIFTMLLTGSPDLDGADSGDVEARAASLLTAFANPALQRQLSDRVGVDRFGIGFGERADQPILTAGKYLGGSTYVESQYRHNAQPTENRAQLMMRYRIAPRWSLETVFGDAAVGAIDLFWGRAFDIRHRRSSSRGRVPAAADEEAREDGDENADSRGLAD